MGRWIGELNMEGPIPKILFVRQPLENTHDYIRRLARAISFAFAIDLQAGENDPDFDVKSEMLIFPDALVARTTTQGTMALSRDRERIELTGADQICVFMVEQGSADASPTRSGRPLRPGDIVIFDFAQPCGLVQYHTQVIRLIFGRSMLPESVRNLFFNGCVIPAGHALAGLIASMASQIIADSERMSPTQAMAVLQSILDFLGMALQDVQARTEAQPALATTVRILIDNNLDRRDLTPEWIASQVGVSRATLYRTLRPLGGVREFIVRRRLQRAWTLIASSDTPDFTRIAQTSGFGTRARLSVAFSKTLGVTLEQFASAAPERRQDILGQATDDILATWVDLTGRRNVEGSVES